MKFYEIKPIDTHKSFYGLAKVYKTHSRVYLVSYGLRVAYLDKEGNLHRLWDGWSATTARHIVSFIGHSLSKKEWLSMPVEKGVKYI